MSSQEKGGAIIGRIEPVTVNTINNDENTFSHFQELNMAEVQTAPEHRCVIKKLVQKNRDVFAANAPLWLAPCRGRGAFVFR